MTNQEIKELAGHREVPPWVMKLVADAVAMEREACAKVADGYVGCDPIAESIQARVEA